MPQGGIGVILAIKVERDPIAVVANLPHRGLDVLHATPRDGIVEDHAGIIAVVSKRGLEQAGERSPSRSDRTKFIVEVPAPKESNANTHALEASPRQMAEPVRRDRDVLHAFDEGHDAVRDQGRLAANEQRRVDVAGALPLDEDPEPRQVSLVLRPPVEFEREEPASPATEVARVGDMVL